MTDRTHIGRVALVTGASSGLGAFFARELARAGARVIVGARRTERLEDLVADIEAAGGEAMAVQLDVADEGSVVAAYDAAETHFGVVDTIIGNAGMNVDGSSSTLSVADFDAIHAVNTRGAFLTVREGGRRLRAASSLSNRGRALIVASMGGITPLPGLVAYSASKAAAVMLARSFAKEWVRDGICVNALCPGYILTEITDKWFSSPPGQRMIDRFPRSRLMPAEALWPIVSHLTSDAGAYFTGGVIPIDDGQLL